MTKWVVDASAWFEYINGSEIGLLLKKYMEKEENEMLTSAVTLSEVLSKCIRQKKDHLAAWEAINAVSRIVEADIALARTAGELHAHQKTIERKFSLGDGFVLATARRTQAGILTADSDFKGIREAHVFQK